MITKKYKEPKSRKRRKEDITQGALILMFVEDAVDVTGGQRIANDNLDYRKDRTLALLFGERPHANLVATLLGGKSDNEEEDKDLRKAAKREAEEETRYQIDINKLNYAFCFKARMEYPKITEFNIYTMTVSTAALKEMKPPSGQIVTHKLSEILNNSDADNNDFGISPMTAEIIRLYKEHGCSQKIFSGGRYPSLPLYQQSLEKKRRRHQDNIAASMQRCFKTA